MSRIKERVKGEGREEAFGLFVFFIVVTVITLRKKNPFLIFKFVHFRSLLAAGGLDGVGVVGEKRGAGRGRKGEGNSP